MRPSIFLLSGFSLLMVAITLVANFGYGSDFLSVLSVVPMGLGDKLGHMLLFGTLALLANLATRHRSSPLATALVALTACIDEFSQQFLIHRSYDLFDLGASLIGVVVAGTIAAAIAPRWRPEHQRKNELEVRNTARIAGK